MIVVLLCGYIAAQSNAPHQVLQSKDDSIGWLARAASLFELQKAYADCPKTFPQRAVYAARYAALRGQDADQVLLKSLPTNGKEMVALYEAQDTPQGQDMAVTTAYTSYYSAIADAVVRHPEYLPDFLRIIHAFHYIDNVDEWPWLCELSSSIYEKIPTAYMRAVSKLQQPYRKEALECRTAPDAP